MSMVWNDCSFSHIAGVIPNSLLAMYEYIIVSKDMATMYRLSNHTIQGLFSAGQSMRPAC